MASARDADAFFPSTSFPTSPTNVSGLTIAAGSDRYLSVFLNWLRNGTEISTAPTWNGVSLTHVANYVHSGGPYGSLWELIAPATGTFNLVVTHTGVTFSAFLGSYTGVDQVTPRGTIASDITFAGTSVSLSPASAVGDLVIGYVNKNGGTALGVTGTGASLRQSGDDADLDGIAGMLEQTAAAGTTTGGFSWTTAASGVMVSFALKASAGGAGVALGSVLRASASCLAGGLSIGSPSLGPTDYTRFPKPLIALRARGIQ